MVTLINSWGDGIMALFDGFPGPCYKCCYPNAKTYCSFNLHRHKQGYEPINIESECTRQTHVRRYRGIERMEGTVISDSVNLGSRIEGLTKIYGIKIAISEKHFNSKKNPNNFHFRFLDRVQVKGKKQAISIYRSL